MMPSAGNLDEVNTG